VSIKIQPRRGSTRIQFILPDDVHDGPVSVVGTFNDWTPGVHKLVRRSNGTRSVSVEVPAGEEIRFRYLGSGGVWFDDDDAHLLEGQGALVNA
jgi:1,4-alpha-glucan branching enzyme